MHWAIERMQVALSVVADIVKTTAVSAYSLLRFRLQGYQLKFDRLGPTDV